MVLINLDVAYLTEYVVWICPVPQQRFSENKYQIAQTNRYVRLEVELYAICIQNPDLDLLSRLILYIHTVLSLT